MIKEGIFLADSGGLFQFRRTSNIICRTVNVTPQAKQTANCLINTSPLKYNFMQKAVV